MVVLRLPLTFLSTVYMELESSFTTTVSRLAADFLQKLHLADG